MREGRDQVVLRRSERDRSGLQEDLGRSRWEELYFQERSPLASLLLRLPDRISCSTPRQGFSDPELCLEYLLNLEIA